MAVHCADLKLDYPAWCIMSRCRHAALPYCFATVIMLFTCNTVATITLIYAVMLLRHCHAALPLWCCFASIFLLCLCYVTLPLACCFAFVTLLHCHCHVALLLYDGLPFIFLATVHVMLFASVMLFCLSHACYFAFDMLLWQHLCASHCRLALFYPAHLSCNSASPSSFCPAI